MICLLDLAAALLMAGTLFILLAVVGIIRMPDLFTRMSAASKAASLGTSLCLAAVAVHFGEVAVAARAVAGIFFVFLTIPVAAHMVARAGYLSGVPISDRTHVDELRGRYDSGTLDLEGRGGGRE